MRSVVSSHATTRAALLADALAETVAELRLIEPGHMIGYIRGQKWATIADLVQSASELSLREGSLQFACMADFEVGWATSPSISFDLEFQAGAVSAFFSLIMGRRESLIDIKSVWFARAPESETAGTALLARAVADARLIPRLDT
jgi:hypothetical protein